MKIEKLMGIVATLTLLALAVIATRQVVTFKESGHHYASALILLSR